MGAATCRLGLRIMEQGMARWVLAPLCGVAALWASQACAGEVFAGVYQHDVNDGISALGNFEGGAQVVFGAKTAALDELKVIGRPRVHLLAGVNTKGGTNYVAAGLSWRFHLTSRFYLEPGIGLATHDGRVSFPNPEEPGITPEERAKRLNDWETKLDLGSRVVFEPEFTVGWKATERLSVEASWIHLSHAKLASSQNPGLGDVGVRLVYRYGVDR